MTEKSEFREMRSFDLAIRRAYFKAQIRRNYAKNVVINRSEIGPPDSEKKIFDGFIPYMGMAAILVMCTR